MPQYKMQAVDSVDGTVHYWLAETADFAAAGYTGPNAATHVAVLAIAGAVGGSSGSASFAVPTWLFDTGTTNADPGAGKLRFNNATLVSVTGIYINAAGVDGQQFIEPIKSLRAGDIVHLQQPDGIWLTGQLTATPSDESDYVALSVEVVSSGGTFAAGTNVSLTPFPATRQLAPTWTFDASTTDVDPGNGKFRLDEATPTQTDATWLYIDDSEAFSIDWSTLLAGLTSGAYIAIQENGNDARWLCEVTGAAVDASGYVKIPIDVISTRGAVNFADGALCSFAIYGSSSGAVDAADVTYSDPGGFTGASNVEGALESVAIYQEPLLNGKVIGQSGTPAYDSAYSVVRKRTQDGAVITRLSSNVYKANLTKSTTHNAASAVELATVYMEANTTAVIGVVIHATETGTPTVRANLRFHVDVQCEADNDMVKIDALSSHTAPDALPLSSVPDWIGAAYANFNSLVTIDLATDNYVKIKVTPANTDTVRWSIDVDATITEL